MTPAEIVKALRFCKFGEPCSRCPVENNKNCINVMHERAADLIERLEKEKAALLEKQRWVPATEPPKEWRDEKTGYMINYLFNSIHCGVSIGNYHAEAGWSHNGLPVTVTHWMPMPKAPEVE